MIFLKAFSIIRRLNVFLFAVLAITFNGVGHSATTNYANLYSLDEALRLGTVDFSPNPYITRPYQPTINEIGTLGPGALVELGFLYGGVSQDSLNTTSTVANDLRLKLPQTLLGTRFPEHFDTVQYPVRENLTCGGSMGTRSFNHRDMVRQNSVSLPAWVDLTIEKTREYFLCIGKFYIDNGFTMLGFTNPSGMLENYPNPSAMIAAFIEIQSQLNQYAASKGAKIYWGGDVHTSYQIPTDYAFQPMRVNTDSAWAAQWKNRIERLGVGNGYSYTLSRTMINDMKALAKAGTKILFFVDNFDGMQDDLRRFMELDAINRRYFILESVRLAKANGVFVTLPLTHCEGCVDKSLTGDACHTVPTPNPNTLPKTAYNALACGDFPAIQDALRMTTDQQIVTSIYGANSYGIWSPEISAKGDCQGNVIYHGDSQFRFTVPDANSYGIVKYRINSSGTCNAVDEQKRDVIKTAIQFVNEYAICSTTIQSFAGCATSSAGGSCIWHNGTNLAYKFSASDVGKMVNIVYSGKSSSWGCQAVEEIAVP
jgi:hypothetical protein